MAVPMRAAEVMVLMVAVEFCGVVPLRVRVLARSEQVAYWAGVTGVQVRATFPVNAFSGVRVSW